MIKLVRYLPYRPEDPDSHPCHPHKSQLYICNPGTKWAETGGSLQGLMNQLG